MAEETFTTGAVVPRSGIYSVAHAAHHLPQEIILLSGEAFPRCAKCSDKVRFALIRAARRVFHYNPMKVYELPCLEEGTE